jgi:glycosyltransferase involved in cell wall biosynthesis
MSAEEREQNIRLLKEYKITLIDFRYHTFGLIAIIKWLGIIIRLLLLVLFKPSHFIHAWCTPAGAIGYFLSKFSGRPLIIDSYEPHAEAMVENKTWSMSSLKYIILFFLEKKLSKHAKTVISATEGMRDYAIMRYGINIKDFYVKPACVDLNKFNSTKRKNPALLRELNLENKIVCVYAGKFGGIYLTNEVFDFFHSCEKKWKDKFVALILTSHSKAELEEWAMQSGFDKNNMVVKYVPHEKIADYLGLGDFGITPVKPIPTKRYCTPIKDGEYWALGLPVVITSGISDDSDIIENNNAGVVIPSLDHEGYQSAIEKLDELLKENPVNTSMRIENIARKYRSFNIAKQIYHTIYGKN